MIASEILTRLQIEKLKQRAEKHILGTLFDYITIVFKTDSLFPTSIEEAYTLAVAGQLLP
jgi:hypothetical protein